MLKVEGGYPNPYDLKKLEYDTINYLRSNPVIAGNNEFHSFHTELNLFFHTIRDINLLYRIPFKFESGFYNLENNLHFTLGFIIQGTQVNHKKRGQLQKEYHLVSYQFTICRKIKNSIIPIRRFHFDYAVKHLNQPGPIFHMQFPGRLSNYILKLGADCSAYDNRFESSLDIPRINYMPVTMAFLLDAIFNEFSSLITDKIRKDGKWLGILHANEIMVMKPHYENCFNILRSSECKPTNLFLRNFCYGNNK
ncbi:MAG: hypothetical protein A2315_12005 [Ignavibacteria bacterium RIFOXYB2_FULL_35_12]|nr:MAG: hypothetical protein A2058_14970 [Ignavibacteria bacterium GWA2_36_19]OGU61774.1 MAG: hypothetical protein A2X60_00090 [Ignavibacteria bacterium GWF2_35_20]OGU78190.1 MAG: hypothetical protein A2254_11665 [Ignavibacteria bacterium RIFOXYA2_FULL_35_9]OGU85833.1 MAG: hypothetical protein A3K31_07895 [Ignavibacteria bacterium RIFOXYA12_FULL_35_25]OGU89578.1 MAG: hypothetical protein A2492_11115 [Ignavibacteria bacterium RIFOXYC12_FULL_35_11]OGU96510.1 MAG: hypothetical protein A2347_10645